MGWRLAADVVLVVHLAFIVFVVVGGSLVLRWRGVARFHVPAAVYGALILVAGFTCPLTPLEKSLRRRAGQAGFEGGFVEHYVVPVIYPGEFTTGVKLVLAGLVIAVNLVVYGAWLVRGSSPEQSGR